MAVTVLVGDLLASRAQTLVNTVNCVGVMGKGVALQFKKRFPVMYRDYVRRCELKEVKLGEPYVWRPARAPDQLALDGESSVERAPERWVLNFPTKDHWRGVSKLADIQRGLEFLRAHYKEWGITSLAVPPLGCGQGGLEWRVVGRTLYRELRKLDIAVELYAPAMTPADQLAPQFLSQDDDDGDGEPVDLAADHRMPKIPAAWVALVQIVDRLARGRHTPPVGRTTFQKIAYFATVVGIPTGFEFRRASYGPFAPDVRSLLTKLVNNGVIVEKPLGEKMLLVRPGPTARDAYNVYASELRAWEPQLAKVADLFGRMTSHDAEVAATVLYCAGELKAKRTDVDERDVFDAVMAWKAERVSENEVAEAVRHLNILSWLGVAPADDLPLEREEIGERLEDFEDAHVA